MGTYFDNHRRRGNDDIKSIVSGGWRLVPSRFGGVPALGFQRSLHFSGTGSTTAPLVVTLSMLESVRDDVIE